MEETTKTIRAKQNMKATEKIGKSGGRNVGCDRDFPQIELNNFK